MMDLSVVYDLCLASFEHGNENAKPVNCIPHPLPINEVVACDPDHVQNPKVSNIWDIGSIVGIPHDCERTWTIASVFELESWQAFARHKTLGTWNKETDSK